MVTFKRYGFLFVLAVMGCGQTTPTPEKLFQAGLEVAMPPVLKAKTICIVASPSAETAEMNAFSTSVVKCIAEQINTRGFNEGSVDTTEKADESLSAHASICTEEEAASQQPQADVTLRVTVNDYALDAHFSAGQVDITRRFHATVLVYGKDSIEPYTVTSKFELTATAAPPESTGVTAVPTWSDGGYSDDEAVRLQQYAHECANAVISSLVQLATKHKP